MEREMKNVCINSLVVSALLTYAVLGLAAEKAQEPDSAGVASVTVKKGASPEQCRFGPAIDVVFDSDLEGKNYVLDLDTQRLITPAREMAVNRLWKSGRLSFPESALAWRAYLRGLGADIVNENNLTGLRMCLAKLEALKDKREWDSLSATECSQRIDGLSEESHPLNDCTIVCHRLPSTWIFQTREGNRGMFQVYDIQHQPKRVGIRYKLIKTTPLN